MIRKLLITAAVLAIMIVLFISLGTLRYGGTIEDTKSLVSATILLIPMLMLAGFIVAKIRG
jgi:hypothetical protein